MAKTKNAAPAVETKAPAVETQAPAATLAAPLEPVQLTIADLQLLSRVVDLASRRGAFQANELTQVGEVFDKLTGFLAYIESIQPKDGTTEETKTA